MGGVKGVWWVYYVIISVVGVFVGVWTMGSGCKYRNKVEGAVY